MQEIKTYNHNLKMIELFSQALSLNPEATKNNPNIRKILKSNTYEAIAA